MKLRACSTKATDPHVDPSARVSSCLLCWLYEFDAHHRTAFGGDPADVRNPTVPKPVRLEYAPTAPLPEMEPTSLGRIRLSYCKRREKWDWHTEKGHGKEDNREDALREAAETLRHPYKWAYGVTTVVDAQKEWRNAGFERTTQNRNGLLQRTVASLSRAGFDQPRLFVDGDRDGKASGIIRMGLDATYRWPAILTWGNWFLAFQELAIRNPDADLYALFQDDMVTANNLRAYLDTFPIPEKCYWNLYSSALTEPNLEPVLGWHPTPIIGLDGAVELQAGLGAVATVMSRAAVMELLRSPHATKKAFDPRPEFRHKKADGGLVTALNYVGYKEMVHLPSLVQHTGLESSMGNGAWPPAATFPGESFDLLELLL